MPVSAARLISYGILLIAFFAPDRSGVFTGSEIADRKRGMFITLTIEDQV